MMIRKGYLNTGDISGLSWRCRTPVAIRVVSLRQQTTQRNEVENLRSASGGRRDREVAAQIDCTLGELCVSEPPMQYASRRGNPFKLGHQWLGGGIAVQADYARHFGEDLQSAAQSVELSGEWDARATVKAKFSRDGSRFKKRGESLPCEASVRPRDSGMTPNAPDRFLVMSLKCNGRLIKRASDCEDHGSQSV
jgi:hypothetical protein